MNGQDYDNLLKVKVKIEDRNALGSVPLENLLGYMESTGWKLKTSNLEFSTIYEHYGYNHIGLIWHVVVPNSNTESNYPNQVLAVIAVLAEMEKRSQLLIFHDMVKFNASNIEA